MLQIEKPDDLQSIANLIRFFRMHDNRRKEADGKFE